MIIIFRYILAIIVLMQLFTPYSVKAQTAEDDISTMTEISNVVFGVDTSQTSAQFDGNNFDLLPFKGSIMYKGDRLDKLYTTLRGYDDPQATYAAVIEELTAVDAAQEQGSTIQAPSFFLSSILFYTPESWTIWLNSRRIRKGQNEPDIKILSISEDTIEVAWQHLSLDVISPGWTEKLEHIQTSIDAKTFTLGADEQSETQRKKDAFEQNAFQWDYKSPSGEIYVDSTNSIVKFKLGLHQSFVTKTMDIVEGFRDDQVVTLDTTGNPLSEFIPENLSTSSPVDEADAIIDEILSEED